MKPRYVVVNDQNIHDVALETDEPEEYVLEAYEFAKNRDQHCVYYQLSDHWELLYVRRGYYSIAAAVDRMVN